MPKIGVYDYPVISLDEAISYLKILKERCGGDAKRETFSQEIGKKGGWFNMIVGTMSDFGLVETGSGRISIGELGKKILLGLNESEIKQSKIESARKYRLFVELGERFPKGATLEQFQIYLRDVGNVDLEVVKKDSSKVYKVYSDTAKYLISAEEPTPFGAWVESAGGQTGLENEIMAKPPNTLELPATDYDLVVKSKDYGNITIKDDVGIIMLEAIIRKLRVKYGMKES